MQLDWQVWGIGYSARNLLLEQRIVVVVAIFEETEARHVRMSFLFETRMRARESTKGLVSACSKGGQGQKLFSMVKRMEP